MSRWVRVPVRLRLGVVIVLSFLGIGAGAYFLVDALAPSSAASEVRVPVDPSSPVRATARAADGATFGIQMPAGSVHQRHTLTIKPLSDKVRGQVVGMTVTRLFEVRLVTEQGDMVEHPEFDRPVTLTATYTDLDLADAAGDAKRLTILWFNDVLAARPRII